MQITQLHSDDSAKYMHRPTYLPIYLSEREKKQTCVQKEKLAKCLIEGCRPKVSKLTLRSNRLKPVRQVVLLEHSQSHSFTHYILWFSLDNVLSSHNRDCLAHRA